MKVFVDNKKNFFLLLSFLLALAMMFSVQVNESDVAYAATAPDYTISYYMNTVDTSTLYSMGYTIGQADLEKPGAQETLIILDFGGQNTNYNASLFWYPDVTLSQVASAIKEFSRGYYNGTGRDVDSTLRVVVGTNNSYTVNYNAGKAWANMINDIYTYNKDRGYNSQVRVYGGNDMEMDYATATATRNWVDGYASVYNRLYYNFGDAAGCTTSTSYDGKTNLSCNNGWKMNDVWYVSYGADPALVIPEIYNNAMAQQWKNIKKYACVGLDSYMHIGGTLTQKGACEQNPDDPTCSGTYTPSAGWTALYNKLNSDPDTEQTLKYSTDIKWH